MTKDAEEVANDETIARIQAIRDGHVETLAIYPTASLWIQYLDMIRIIRKFIRAERLGNCYLNPEAVSGRYFRTWPLLVTRCAKSASIYLSSMVNLPNDHPVVRQHFVEGVHVARRSDLAMPACAEVNRAMQELSGAKYSTN